MYKMVVMFFLHVVHLQQCKVDLLQEDYVCKISGNNCSSLSTHMHDLCCVTGL